MDALTPAGRFFGPWGHERRLSPTGLPDFGPGTADHSVSNHRCNDRGPPGCPAIWLAPIARFAGFVFRSKTRPSTPTESSSRRLSPGTTCVTDWSFSFRCSPPRIAATQLRFDTARFFTAQKRTSTALSHCPLRRTSAAFRLQEHGSKCSSSQFPAPSRMVGFCSLTTSELHAWIGADQGIEVSPLTPSLSPSDGERVPFRAGEGLLTGPLRFHGSGCLSLKAALRRPRHPRARETRLPQAAQM